MKELIKKLRLWWWAVTHIIELVDYQAERIDCEREAIFDLKAKVGKKKKAK